MEIQKDYQGKWLRPTNGGYIVNASAKEDVDKVILMQAYVPLTESKDEWEEITQEEAERIRRAKDAARGSVDYPEQKVTQIIGLFATGNAYVEQVREAIKGEDAQLMIISAQTEADIAELETYEEKQMFLEDLGLKESGCNRLIKAIYSLLNLETFITAGEMEVKAWTYHKGWKAPQCAGVIHTDFEKGFIRAEVIKYDDYIKYGSEAAVREAGKLSIEGKDYVVQDGDIMHFRFNV